MNAPVATVVLRYERDIVLARQRARQIAAGLGFDDQDQTRISTAVSEIARNAFEYGRGGAVHFALEGRTAPQLLVVRVSDDGPGIADLPSVLDGSYRSRSGMGVGLIGARRLMDRFEVRSQPGCGTEVTLRKFLPRGRPALGPDEIAVLADRLTREQPRDAVEEVQRQNQELLRTLSELTRRQEELANLNRELEDTNRGVVALYAELDEKADHLRRADEIKTRFISNMSHEFRTPVNSIQALAGILLSRVDGDLTPEQERQVVFVQRAADALSELVNDLLDLAKVEAGKTVVRPVEFQVPILFGALRGMLRPLLVNESVRLVFEPADDLPVLDTDEGKVSQILRNFISNALKFTERGEVRVAARLAGPGRVAFDVTDTGIGIAPEDQERIFQEFTQIENPLQRRVRGTGLGLPLCRRLAELLGGSVSMTSRPGLGSTFTVELPIRLPREPQSPLEFVAAADDRLPVLVVEDDADTLLVYEKYLSGSEFRMLAARNLRQAREAIQAVRPRAIVLDIVLAGEDAWELLAEVKRRDEFHSIPVLVVTSVDDPAKANALGADAYCAKPVGRAPLLHHLGRLVHPASARRLLVVDDDTIARYLVRQSLAALPWIVSEAEGGREGLERARADAPDVVFLDLSMPDLDGTVVLAELKADPRTRDIPVVIVTSRALDEETRAALAAAECVLPKSEICPERVRAAIEAALPEVAS